MSAHYDSYDYPSYWDNRGYEHQSEVIALNAFLARIPKLKKILEIGAGFGRLTPHYIYRAEKLVLADPSRKLLNIAKKTFTQKKVIFIQSDIENLPQKIRPHSQDLIILVRVLHHVKDVARVFIAVRKMLSKNGYFILEFPNKNHLKAVVRQFFKGNFTFLLDIFPKDIRSKKFIKPEVLPFNNYHPDKIKELLIESGFKIIETRSVSNIRSPLMKKFLPFDFILFLEKCLQKILSYINFGPSLFILVKRN